MKQLKRVSLSTALFLSVNCLAASKEMWLEKQIRKIPAITSIADHTWLIEANIALMLGSAVISLLAKGRRVPIKIRGGKVDYVNISLPSDPNSLKFVTRRWGGLLVTWDALALETSKKKVYIDVAELNRLSDSDDNKLDHYSAPQTPKRKKAFYTKFKIFLNKTKSTFLSEILYKKNRYNTFTSLSESSLLI